MEENKNLEIAPEETEVETSVEEVVETQTPASAEVEDTETPLDKNVRLLSPGRMLLRRFFRSKLSIVGLVMLITLFAFCWFGPVVYRQWNTKPLMT